MVLARVCLQRGSMCLRACLRRVSVCLRVCLRRVLAAACVSGEGALSITVVGTRHGVTGSIGTHCGVAKHTGTRRGVKHWHAHRRRRAHSTAARAGRRRVLGLRSAVSAHDRRPQRTLTFGR